MGLRKKFLPPTAVDIGCFLMSFTMISVTFVFELAIVQPEFYDMGGFLFIFNWIIGVFLVFNIKANMIVCMLVDTSIQSEVLQPPTDAEQRKLWHYCSDCETLAPPRCWHCKRCRMCILKRDHHCFLIGSCVGHKNYRFFLLFMIYICIGLAYSTIYNTIYFWMLYADTSFNLSTFLKTIFAIITFAQDMSWNNFYLVFYMWNLVFLAFTIFILSHHMHNVLHGGVMFERHKTRQYDSGWKQNLEMVLGRRMHLVWLSPFLKSELPHDGIHWETITSN